ncbi:hypothetical protein BH23GEM9_BH23GEM9_08940 [soil metagenome]
MATGVPIRPTAVTHNRPLSGEERRDAETIYRWLAVPLLLAACADRGSLPTGVEGPLYSRNNAYSRRAGCPGRGEFCSRRIA